MADYRKGNLPPYLTYATWLKLVESLEQFLPPQFDRSYWDGLRFSGSTRAAAKATLSFLGLMGADARPTDKLQRLLAVEERQRAAELRHILEQAYQPVVGGLELDKATLGQLEERFRECGARGQLGGKCISLFLALAREAGLPLSPPLELRSRAGRAPRTVVRRERSRRTKAETVKLAAERVSWTELLEELLLRDFPDFDPTWPDDVKIKWLLRELMDRASRNR